MYHHEDYVRTSSDLRLEVSNGDCITVSGTTYTIQETHKRKITHAKIPISTKYAGESMNNIPASSGGVSSTHMSYELRTLFLAEMVARVVKNIIRLQMRTYNMQYKCASTTFYTSLIVEYMNVLTGSSTSSDVIIQQTICDSIRERFGAKAVLPSERGSILKSLRPVLSFIINRIVSMLGVQLCISCETEFQERPIAFVFSVADILSVVPVCKHNIPLLPFADAMVVSIQANKVEKEQYLDTVQLSQPVLLYTLSERHGARVCNNKGALGDAFSGSIKNSCELEQPGPVVSNAFIRSVCFRPNAKAYIDVPFSTAIVPSSLLQHFSVECYFKCTGGKDTVRTILMSGRYGVLVTRDNKLCVQFYDAQHEISIKLSPVEYNLWTHLVCTYDGTSVRVYVNSILQRAVEIAPVLAYKQGVFNGECEEKRAELRENEKTEQLDVYDRSQREALEFFQVRKDAAL